MYDLERLREVAEATKLCLVVWTAILAWDWLATLPSEYRTIWRRQWSLLKVVFLLNRYGTLLLEIASAAIILAPMSKAACHRVFWIQPVTLCFVIVVTQTIMSIRVFAIYERRRSIGYCLAVMVLAEGASVVTAATRIGPLELPPAIGQVIGLEGCLVVLDIQHSSRFGLMLAVMPFVFDAITLALVAYRCLSVRRDLGVTLPILARIMRDGLLFYLVITVTHVVTLVLWLQNDFAIKSINVPASIVLPSLMCARLVISLLEKPVQPATINLPELAKANSLSVRPRDADSGGSATKAEGDRDFAYA